MFSKLAILCVGALAVAAQAGHHHKRYAHSQNNVTVPHNPFPSGAGTSSGVAPYPTGTGGSAPLSTGSLALSTGALLTYTTTMIVTKLTTYCPGPTTITQNGKEYTVTTVNRHLLHSYLLLLTGSRKQPSPLVIAPARPPTQPLAFPLQLNLEILL